MSAKQKDMAERLLEILIEMGILKVTDRKTYVGRKKCYMFKGEMTEEQWIKQFTSAIIIYKNECLKKAWEKHKKESGT